MGVVGASGSWDGGRSRSGDGQERPLPRLPCQVSGSGASSDDDALADGREKLACGEQDLRTAQGSRATARETGTSGWLPKEPLRSTGPRLRWEDERCTALPTYECLGKAPACSDPALPSGRRLCHSSLAAGEGCASPGDKPLAREGTEKLCGEEHLKAVGRSRVLTTCGTPECCTA